MTQQAYHSQPSAQSFSPPTDPTIIAAAQAPELHPPRPPRPQYTRDEAIEILRETSALDVSEAVVNAAFCVNPDFTRYTRTGNPLGVLRAALYGFVTRDCFALNQADARAIERQWGIAPERAQALGIRSINHGIGGFVILEAAVQRRFGYRLDYPAGFYLDGERVRICFPERGLIVPCRDRRGFTQALLHYKHPGDSKPYWISSAKHGGAKAVPSLHIAGPTNADGSGIVVLTAHALQAEAIQKGGSITVVGVNGCTPSAVVGQLRTAYPALRGVILDLEPEPTLCHALTGAGLKWEVGL
jgi:hypothetical protein